MFTFCINRRFLLRRLQALTPEESLLVRFKLFCLMIVVLCPPAAWASLPMELGLGARGTALGGAYTAIADDIVLRL